MGQSPTSQDQSRDTTGEAVGVGTAASAPGHSDEAISTAAAAYPPVVVQRVLPDYPLAARKHQIEGVVILRAVVGLDGRVEDPVTVLRSVPLLDQAAIAALKQWHFHPGRDSHGRPVRVRIDVPLRFELRSQASQPTPRAQPTEPLPTFARHP